MANNKNNWINRRYKKLNQHIDKYEDMFTDDPGTDQPVTPHIPPANLIGRDIEPDPSATPPVSNKQNRKINGLNSIKLMFRSTFEIEEYYHISKIQATLSFVLAASTCIIGICILWYAIRMNPVGNEMQSKYLTAISGVIVECFSGTVLVVYMKTLKQLNRYYDSLHQNELFLTYVSLVSKLSEEKQQEMYIAIIRNEMKKRLRDCSNVERIQEEPEKSEQTTK